MHNIGLVSRQRTVDRPGCTDGGGVFSVRRDDKVLPSTRARGFETLPQELHASELAGEHDVVVLAGACGHEAEGEGHLGDHIYQRQGLVRGGWISADLAEIAGCCAGRGNPDRSSSDISYSEVYATQVPVGSHLLQGVETRHSEQV